MSAAYEIGSVINELANLTDEKAKVKGLEFKVSVKPDLPHLLYGDETELKQAIQHILCNAVTYTDHGHVTMSVNYEKCDDETIRLKIRVADTGQGMTQENITKLLEGKDDHLEVSSVFGKGSIFSFSLEQKVLSWDGIGDFKAVYQSEGLYAPSARILIVDDTPVIMTMFRGMLQKTQIRIDTAASGEECLELASKARYHIIFIDHMMPGMDGIETMHHLQEDDDSVNAGVVMIALTANTNPGAKEMYMQEGFTDYMPKPIEGEKLIEMLQQYLPKQLILSKRQMAGEQPKPSADPQSDKSQDDQILSELQKISGIHTEAGIQTCGTKEIYLNVVKEFYPVAEKQAKQIEEYCTGKDYRNYTIQVHSLKSSARLIGASELSEQAKMLEACGNAADEKTIIEETPKLLHAYRIYAKQLQQIFESTDENDAKPPIEGKMLRELLEALCEVAEAFDFDSADSMMETLAKYRMPESFEEAYRSLKVAMAEVARDDIIEIVHSYLNREEH